MPPGGVEAVEVGIRGTSDVLFPLRQDPFGGWSILYRALFVPKLDAGQPCPTSSIDAKVDFAQFGVSQGWGPGPAYPIGLKDGAVVILWDSPTVDARVWGVQKVLWFVHPRYSGLVLIRGRQLDGQNRVRFERGGIPPAELRIDRGVASSTGGRDRPSFVRIRAPGCYAFQVDGTSFSRLVVFRALKDV